jgi:hypothetical protein
MLNLHRLLFKQDDPVSFHAELVPTEGQRGALTDGKNAIRDHLLATIADASISVLKMAKRVEPRFRSQGSWSYRTCVRPAHLPPQEMDWDFGVYLPATFWKGTQPPFAAKAYFELVETSLKVLCRKKGWELASGPGCKDTCIRIRISHWAHIDVCLYAVPEAQFTSIAEIVKADSVGRRSLLAMDDASYLRESSDAGEPPDFPWEQLQDIVMAKRSGEWQASDPFSVTRWFADCIEEHGEQLRRLCRYLKAWRDFHWPQGGGPSSLVLMICAVEAFEMRFHRDDIALQDAAARMCQMLRGDIFVAAIDANKENFNRMTDAERAEAAERAGSLRWAIQLARGYGPYLKSDGVEKLRSALGPRIPCDPNLIEAETEADRVRITAAAPVAAPIVRSTRSG